MPGGGAPAIRCGSIAAGRFRAPDPWFALHDGLAVRRLSPNNRKVEADDNLSSLLGADMLRTMGHDIASVHAASLESRDAAGAWLSGRGRNWLLDAAEKMASTIRSEHLDFVAASLPE